MLIHDRQDICCYFISIHYDVKKPANETKTSQLGKSEDKHARHSYNQSRQKSWGLKLITGPPAKFC